MRHRAEFVAVWLLLTLLRWLPVRAGLAVARVAFRLLDFAVPKLRRAGMTNLKLTFPNWDDTKRERLLDTMYGNLARMVVVFARMRSFTAETIGEWIRYEGREHFTEALKQGKGVLFYTAHLGNWELSAFAHGMLTAPMHVVVRPLDNPYLDRLAEQVRTASGNRLIGKKEFARRILQALGNNEAVGILADQNAGLSDGVFVDFFGRKACAHATFARLAARTGAVVIPGFALWTESEQRYVLRFYPPVEMSGDVVEDTQRLHRVLEDVIRSWPDQWLWVHRRWKTRPLGEPPIYD